MQVTLPNVRVKAVCHDCRKQHTYEVQPTHLADAMGQWAEKHLGHQVAYSRPRPLYEGRWAKWLREFWSECPLWAPLGYSYGHNADAKLAYASSAAYTITLASLASSATFVAGRESTAVSNTSNLYLDYLIGGQVTVGTSPTADTFIQIRAYGSYNDTPTYGDVFDGTDSNETVTSTGILQQFPLLNSAWVDATTSDRAYPVQPIALSSVYVNGIPKNHGLFVAHNTGVNLNATGGNHVLSYTGVYGTVS